MMKRADIARQCFAGANNCAQSVAAAWQPETGIAPQALTAMAAGFGGGVARTREICGALSGAVLAMGAIYARHGMEQAALYADIQTLLAAFKQRHGAVTCRRLLNIPPGTNTAPIHRDCCADYVADAAQLMGEVLFQRGLAPAFNDASEKE